MIERKKIAAIVTTYYPFSHADVILTKFLKGFPTDSGLLSPEVDIVALFLDQIHERDVGLDLADEYGISRFDSIRAALCMGGDELAVDGVLIIGEHGDYALNEKGQHLYPRKYFFEQVCGVFASCGRSVPVFSDKHLSWSWEQSKWMYDRANELEVPFMAGSSLPLTYRKPWLEHDIETPMSEAVSIAYSNIDSYGFHGLELLQCMVERRIGGETGISAVQCLEGNDVWKALEQERWFGELFDAALDRIEPKGEGTARDNCESITAFVLEYNDGFSAATVLLNGEDGRPSWLRGWGYAARVTGKVESCEFFLQGDPHPHFSFLGLNAQELFKTGKPTYPVERTLLVSGALDALLDSRYHNHVRLETPHLNITYDSYVNLRLRASSERPEGAATDPLRPELSK